MKAQLYSLERQVCRSKKAPVVADGTTRGARYRMLSNRYIRLDIGGSPARAASDQAEHFKIQIGVGWGDMESMWAK